MIVALRVSAALVLIKAVWQLGGFISPLLDGRAHWDHLNEAATTAALGIFVLLHARDRQELRRQQRASRG
jgi:hypothetical protein